jgi:hypothetical protein
VAAVLVLVVGAPFAYVTAWANLSTLSWAQLYLLVSIPPLASLALAGLSVIPSRTRPHSNQGDLLGVAVGSLSLWALVGGVALVGVAAVIQRLTTAAARSTQVLAIVSEPNFQLEILRRVTGGVLEAVMAVLLGSAASKGRRAAATTRPPAAKVVKLGIANRAKRGPNHSSNIGASSPARRWKMPKGHPLATRSATPSPRSTAMATCSLRPRRRVSAHNQR